MLLGKIKDFLGLNAFVFLAMGVGFFISFDYAVVRPVSNSLFIHFYGSGCFPYVWLASLPVSFVAVALYNNYIARLGCWRMFLIIASSVVLFNLSCALFVGQVPWLSFFFYAWKEIYILLMFQQLWSAIHATVRQEKARYLYGLLFGCGALGGIAGSLVPGFFAVRVGSERLLFATLPLYLILGGLFALLFKQARPVTFEKRGEPFQGIKLIARSRLLLFILSLVVFMQLSATLVDYQFHSGLATHLPDKDLRTQYAGRIFSMINTATLCLQFLGTFLIVRTLGLKRAHILVPFLLALSAAGYLFFPLFGVLSLSFVLVKALDFSFFGIIREMLYIPMKPEEKFHAKAFIDVFAHRSAKAIASLCILFTASWVLPWVNILLFVIWCIIVVRNFAAPAAEQQKG